VTQRPEPTHRALELLLAWPGLQERRVAAIWLFGSHAQGTANPASDVDLAVLCDPPLGLERTRAMDVLARELGVEVDVVDLGTASPTLAWEVVTTGRIVHEEDELRVEQFVRHTRYAAEDAEQRNRMILLAHVETIGGARA
jgi:predicted nucleotidyltransferase